jgi:hypothetical protein
MILLLLAVASPAFSFLNRVRSGDASNAGTTYFLGGEDVLSVADAKVSEGVAVALALGWSCEASTCVLNSTAAYVGTNNAGKSSGVVTLHFENNTWTGVGEAPMVGRFMYTGDNKLELTGQGTDSNGRALILTAEVTASKLSEVSEKEGRCENQ